MKPRCLFVLTMKSVTSPFESKLLTKDTSALLGSSESSYNVPFDLTGVPAIAKFIGRDSEINRLKDLLPSIGTKRRKVFVLYGLGGIGKTQLAIEFARKHRRSRRLPG